MLDQLDPALAVAICGTIIVPLLTSLLKRDSWPKGAKQITAVVVAGGCAVVQFLAEGGGGWDWNSILANFAVVFTMAQAAYLGFWEGAGSGIEGRVASLPLLPEGLTGGHK